MSHSNGNGIHEDEADLDYENMSEEQKKIFDRRMRIDDMLPYKTEVEIAKEENVDRRTIVRDVVWLKKEVYRRRVDDLAQDGFSFDLLKTKRRLEDKLIKMHTIEETMDNPTRDDLEYLIPLWKIQNDTESLLDNIVGEGPTLQGMKKAVEKGAKNPPT